MSYLDDATRVAQLADLKAFYASTLALRAVADLGPERRALEGRPVVAVDRAGTPQPPGSVAATSEKAFQAPLRDGADEGERPAGALDLCGTRRATPTVYGAFARFTECLAKP